MMFLISFCSSQDFLIRSTRSLPMPGTRSSASGSSSITFSVSAPNARTMRAANFGPMPLTRPEPRYFSIPYTVAGSVSSKPETVNWRPNFGFTVQSPLSVRTEPTCTSGMEPTTVIRSA